MRLLVVSGRVLKFSFVERTNRFREFDDIFIQGKKKKKKILEPARSEEKPLMINCLSQ